MENNTHSLRFPTLIIDDTEEIRRQSEIVTKNVTIEAQLTGHKQTKSASQNVGTKFQHYVLIEYPIGQANQAFLKKFKGMKFLAHNRLQLRQWQSLRPKLKGREAALSLQKG